MSVFSLNSQHLPLRLFPGVEAGHFQFPLRGPGSPRQPPSSPATLLLLQRDDERGRRHGVGGRQRIRRRLRRRRPEIEGRDLHDPAGGRHEAGADARRVRPGALHFWNDPDRKGRRRRRRGRRGGAAGGRRMGGRGGGRGGETKEQRAEDDRHPSVLHHRPALPVLVLLLVLLLVARSYEKSPPALLGSGSKDRLLQTPLLPVLALQAQSPAHATPPTVPALLHHLRRVAPPPGEPQPL